jgi:spermidine/putrescine transport system substrate-binding protein
MRRMRKYAPLTAVSLVSLALILSACAGPQAAVPTATEEMGASPTEPGEPMKEEAPTPEEAEFGRCGDPSQLSDTLNFFNWADYIDEDIITQFEEECGVDVVMDLYTSNEEAIAKIMAGGSGYDVSIPTDYAVKVMSDGGALQPLNLEWIPNHVNLDPNSLGMYYDPDNTYSLPYQWSTTGLAYNAKFFPEAPTSYDVVFDTDKLCEHRGFVSMLDDPRETISMALLYLGYDVNNTDPEVHQQVLDLLRAQKDCIAGYDSENFIRTLAAEEVHLAGSWGFAAALAYLDNDNIRYFIPEEGGVIWQDNMVIPADAPHPYTAHVWINYLLEPDIGAKLTDWTFGFTPNLASAPLLSQEYYDVMNSVGALVDEGTRSRLQWQQRDMEGAEIFADTWTAVKAQ